MQEVKIIFAGIEQSVKIPDGWKQKKEGNVSQNDKCWLPSLSSFHNANNNTIGGLVNSFYLVIEPDVNSELFKNVCFCQSFMALKEWVNTLSWKFCPFCGKEVFKK